MWHGSRLESRRPRSRLHRQPKGMKRKGSKDEHMTPIVDPRRGDIEDDASSTKRRSLLSLAGSLLVEVSLPKLILAWFILLVIPALLLGLSPLVASAWAARLGSKIASPLFGLVPI